jgi:cell division protein FtsB
MSDLTWNRTKDTLVLALGSLLVAFFGYFAVSLASIQKDVACVQKDIAVLVTQAKYDYEERQEMKARIAALETRGNN